MGGKAQQDLAMEETPEEIHRMRPNHLGGTLVLKE